MVGSGEARRQREKDGNHPFRSSTRILDSPPAQLFCRRFTAHSIYASVGTPSSTTNGSMVTGMVSPGGGGVPGCTVWPAPP